MTAVAPRAHEHAIKTMTDERSTKEAWIDKVDFRKSYFDQLESLLDVKAIKKAKLKVAVDAMHGSARLYLRSFLEERLGVDTLISSPAVLPRMARPIGELVEIRPFVASASSGITS